MATIHYYSITLNMTDVCSTQRGRKRISMAVLIANLPQLHKIFPSEYMLTSKKGKGS